MKNKTRNIIITLTIIAGLLFTNTVYASFAEMDDATSDKQRNEQLQEQEQQDKENLGKSSNNYLKGISVKDLKLTPQFDKQTIDYTIEEELDVDAIEISADLDDSRAKISGAGIIKLEPGENNIRIDVTAENGTVRTYHIKVTKKGQKATTENKEENVEGTDLQENTAETVATPAKKSNQNTFITIVIVIAVLVILYILANKSKGKRRK